jgi:hypothetical protein
MTGRVDEVVELVPAKKDAFHIGVDSTDSAWALVERNALKHSAYLFPGHELSHPEFDLQK